jgi:hypothetical protein
MKSLVSGIMFTTVVFLTSAVGANDAGELGKVFTLYEGFKSDRAALVETVERKVASDGKLTVKASSAEACLAARRVFERFGCIGIVAEALN